MSVVVYTASCGARKLNYRREQRSAGGAGGYECVVRAAATIRRLPRTSSPAWLLRLSGTRREDVSVVWFHLVNLTCLEAHNPTTQCYTRYSSVLQSCEW